MKLFERNTGVRSSCYVVIAAILMSVGLSYFEADWLALWPSVAALLVVFVSRSALVGLLTGAIAGAIILAGITPTAFLSQLFQRQFLPIFISEWQLSAIIFTLMLGGFVALLEASGGLQALVRVFIGTERASPKRMQLTVFGFGLLVFFDGLANTMLIGRMLRSAADRCGVSREKLAYLADATGSAVACLAFVSTWIAFQLAMIQKGFEIAGESGSAYALFFKSLPTNFYCWFSLLMVLVCVLREYNPGSMGRVESRARRRIIVSPQVTTNEAEHSSHWLLAIIPIMVLSLSIPVLTYIIGSEVLLPLSLAKFAQAYAAAEQYVPRILVASSVLASFIAGLAWVLGRQERDAGAQQVFPVFLSGIRDLLGPVLILLAAWMLGSAISQLGTADRLAELLNGRLAVGLLPVSIFGLGAIISFSTGTSWGTMGVLMPLAIPVIFSLSTGMPDTVRDQLIVAAIGAVFSGAVFGDHCSPFSDTTIVASIAAGVEPIEHVRTQLNFALITALVAAVFGFLPLGFGISPWICLSMGVVAIGLLPQLRKNHVNTN